MIVVDTSILSHAFRRTAGDKGVIERFGQLVIEEAELALPGIVLQEILSSTRTDAQQDRLDRELRGFRLLLADRDVHVEAARIATTCSRAGVATTAVDCLIAAHTIDVDGALFTADRDFRHIAKHTGLRLYDAT